MCTSKYGHGNINCGCVNEHILLVLPLWAVAATRIEAISGSALKFKNTGTK